MSAPSLPWRATASGLGFRGRLARKDLGPMWRVLKAMADAPLAGLWTPEVLAARAATSIDEAAQSLVELALPGLVELDPHPIVKALVFASQAEADAARLRDAFELLGRFEAVAPRAQASNLRWLADQLRGGLTTPRKAALALREASS